MSDDQAFPPPGAQQAPPPPAPPPHAAVHNPPPGWAPAPGMLGAAHKPGAMPLRPLALGDMYNAAFRIIRFNPKATVGSAVLVASVTMLIPVMISAIFTFTVGAALDQAGEIAPNASQSETVGATVSFASLIGGTILLQIGLIFVTGMIAHVTIAAAIGKRLTLGEAWGATRGKRWKLLGLTCVINLAWILALGVYVGLWALVVTVSSSPGPIVLWGVVTVPAFIAGMVWFWVRLYYLPAPALMLEPVGVFGAIRRGYGLTRQQFWRILGIGVLTIVVTTIAGSMLSGPVSFIGQIASLAVPEYALLGLAVTQAVSSVISSAFVAPFTSAVASLQYIDQRMRKEAFDVELMTRAGITAS
ncbi:MAG: hypothetical protein M3Q98_07060 [Actinomycetota bacterium]|nr:hypothetical protein [Actinomycetota bacterium]